MLWAREQYGETRRYSLNIPAGPLLYRWDDMVLSFSVSSHPGLQPGLHPGLQLRSHRHGAAELVVALDKPFSTKLKHSEVSALSLLIPPEIEHKNLHADPVSAVIYLDVESFCYKQLARRMCKEGPVFTGVPGERDLQQALREVYEHVFNAAECYSLIVDTLLYSVSARDHSLDARLAKILKIIKANPADNASVKDLAALVSLSEDRLHHLFTAQVGIPLHKYRIWLRLKCVGKLFFDGFSLTMAAHEAGFSDGAHFSRTFARMYGAPPSKLLSGYPKSRVFFA